MKHTALRRVGLLLALLLAAVSLAGGAGAVTIKNVKIASGIMTWTPLSGASDYYVGVDGHYASKASGLDLDAFIEELLASGEIQNTPTHVIGMDAFDENGSSVGEWTGKYSYLSPNYPEYKVPTVALKRSAAIAADGTLSWQAYSTGTAYYGYGAASGKVSVSNMTTDLSVNIHSYIDAMASSGDLPTASSYKVTLQAIDGAGKVLDSWSKTIKYKPKITKTSLNPETATVSGISDKGYTWTGKAIKPKLAGLFVQSKVLKQGTDYTVAYKANKNVGIGKVVITGKGRFKGTLTLPSTINPKGTKLASLKAGKRSITAKWKAQAKQTTGYEVQYATTKAFKGATTVRVKGTKKTGAALKALKSGKKYFVRVRTYKVAGGKTYYSAWSAPLNAKAK